MKPVGVAVIGAGYWGPNLARNFLACPDVDLRWICDLDRERAARAVGPRSTVGVTDELEQVLADPRVEAVAVATPAWTHFEVALAALEAGKHVLVEKPFASSVAEGEKLVAMADRKGLVVMCDHTYCYTPAVRRLRELIGEGALGDIQYFDSVRINLGLVQPDVDIFWDLAAHDLSILDFILPDGCLPEAVGAQGADPIGVGHPCVGYLTLPLAGGGIAHIHVNWLSPTKIRTTIVGGSRRIAVWDDNNPSQRLSMYDKGVNLTGPTSRTARREALVNYRIGDMVAPALPEVEGLAGVVRELAAAVREGRQALTDGESGVRVLRILDAVPQSLAAGGAVVPLASTPGDAG
ncbi:MAG TPA: Gfo/Idh/MocA family oxidoreductase [Actinomycetes bacterium]|nr:Gfo/Idh/MocA family oxidoreductase [Actinomycetes bacterium]